MSESNDVSKKILSNPWASCKFNVLLNILDEKSVAISFLYLYLTLFTYTQKKERQNLLTRNGK